MSGNDEDLWMKLQLDAQRVVDEHAKEMRENELAQARALRDRIKKTLATESSANEEPSNGDAARTPETKSDIAESENETLPVYEEETSTENALKVVALRREETYLENQQQNLALRKDIANVAVWAVGTQMFLTNVTFIGYMNAVDYQPESEVMISWMASTVVQIVGIAMVVTRNLFPSRNGNSKKDEEGDV